MEYTAYKQESHFVAYFLVSLWIWLEVFICFCEGGYPNISGLMLCLQGRYEILSLMGSFFPHDARGGNLPQTGGLSVSLACADGRVIGGSVAGLLLAASPIQVFSQISECLVPL